MKFIYNMIICGTADLICLFGLVYGSRDTKPFFFMLLTIALCFTLIRGIFTYPIKKEIISKTETLRLEHLSTGDRVLVVKGHDIKRKGIIKQMFEDYDLHVGMDFSTACVLLSGDETTSEFYPECLEVIKG